MNIESVKKLIASLEAAGELTIKERIYLYSMKEHMALAEENSLMRKLLPDYISVPATDNFLASLRAEGVGTYADFLAGLGWHEQDISNVRNFAAQLRSQSAPSPEINDASDIEPFGFVRRSGDQIVIDVNGDPHIKDGMPVYTRQSEQVKGVQS